MLKDFSNITELPALTELEKTIIKEKKKRKVAERQVLLSMTFPPSNHVFRSYRNCRSNSVEKPLLRCLKDGGKNDEILSEGNRKINNNF
jgi:hypothetical protein